jgi:hypothetical protein
VCDRGIESETVDRSVDPNHRYHRRKHVNDTAPNTSIQDVCEECWRFAWQEASFGCHEFDRYVHSTDLFSISDSGAHANKASQLEEQQV